MQVGRIREPLRALFKAATDDSKAKLKPQPGAAQQQQREQLIQRATAAAQHIQDQTAHQLLGQGVARQIRFKALHPAQKDKTLS